MAKFLKISETFKKAYKKLPEKARQKMDKQLRFLSCDPAHPSLKLHVLEGTGGIWEGYVDDSYRFTFEIQEKFYYLRAVGPHKIIDLEARRKTRHKK